MNDLDGREGSMLEVWGKRGDLDHSSFHNFFNRALWACLRAGMLRGSGFLSGTGNRFAGLE